MNQVASAGKINELRHKRTDVRQTDIDNQTSQNTATASADRLTTLHITHTNRPKIAGTRPSSMQFKKILLLWPNEQISERTDQNVTQSIQ